MNLTDEARTFLTERHLATLSIPRLGSAPHVTPVGVTFDPDTAIARVITWSGAVKTRLLHASPGVPVAVCQVDGGRWLTLSGPAHISTDADEIEIAESMYAARYRPPKSRDDRTVVRISVESILGRA